MEPRRSPGSPGVSSMADRPSPEQFATGNWRHWRAVNLTRRRSIALRPAAPPIAYKTSGSEILGDRVKPST